MQFHRNDFPITIAEALGSRFKRARLNKNLTQYEVPSWHVFLDVLY